MKGNYTKYKDSILNWRSKNKDSYNEYMLIYNKTKRYCKTPELIENYELAKADNFKGWVCHHRLEKDYFSYELKALGRYWNVSAEELIFLREGYHRGNTEIHKKWVRKNRKIL